MSKPSPLFGLALLVPTLVASCFSIPESKRFSHDFHRMKYRLADNELRGVQFYISTDVIVHTENPEDRSPTGKNTVFVAKGTPGVVTDVGPNWLRVSFRRGGKGTLFMTDPSAENDVYKYYALATQLAGGSVKRVADVEGHYLMDGTTRYEVVTGADAVLLIDSGDLQRLIDKRKLSGRRTPK